MTTLTMSPAIRPASLLAIAVVPVVPDSAPFTPAQRAWLNGFLAGYFARLTLPDCSSAPVPASKSLIPLLILYGSQTGTAEALARRGKPFIFTTGYGQRGIPQAYKDRPLLPKPYQMEQLGQALVQAVNRR